MRFSELFQLLKYNLLKYVLVNYMNAIRALQLTVILSSDTTNIQKGMPPATARPSDLAKKLAAQFGRPGRLVSCITIASDSVSETERLKYMK